MLVPHLPLALEYYNKITSSKNETELSKIAGELKELCTSNPDFKEKWRNWLIDIFTSHKEILKSPDWRDSLNAEGLKHYEKTLKNNAAK